MLPTENAKALDDAHWAKTLKLLQGPLLQRCEATPLQTRLLLDIVLAYRAFSSGEDPNVDPDEFYGLATQLVMMGRDVPLQDAADRHLLDVVD